MKNLFNQFNLDDIPAELKDPEFKKEKIDNFSNLLKENDLDDLLNENIEELLSIISDLLPGKWKLTEKEITRIAAPLSRILDKYIPGIIAKNFDESLLTLLLFIYFIKRMKPEKKLEGGEERPGQQQNNYNKNQTAGVFSPDPAKKRFIDFFNQQEDKKNGNQQRPISTGEENKRSPGKSEKLSGNNQQAGSGDQEFKKSIADQGKNNPGKRSKNRSTNSRAGQEPGQSRGNNRTNKREKRSQTEKK